MSHNAITQAEIEEVAKIVGGSAFVFLIASDEARSRLSRLIATVPSLRLAGVRTKGITVGAIRRNLELFALPRDIFAVEQVERIFVPEGAPGLGSRNLRAEVGTAILLADPQCTRGEMLIALGWTTLLNEIGREWRG